jgi:DNA polymerase III delta prime subunit
MSTEVTFKNLAATDNLSHAYLLWGYGPQEGKIAIIQEFLLTLEPAPFVDSLIMFPDKEGTTGIDAVRDAQRFIWQKPARSVRKTIIVADAATLTREAQDAFLKIVEEPPEHGLVLFVARDPAFLSPALQSRFQKLYVPAPADVALPEDAVAEADEFLNAGASGRKEIMKQILERDDIAVNLFATAVMASLDKNSQKNWRVLKEMSYRLILMGRHTTNRKLQWEAISSYI